MIFQNNFSRTSTSLDLVNRPPFIIPASTDPRDSLKKNILKPKKDFSNYNKLPPPIIAGSVNMFQRGIIENVSGGNKNCSSCGGAK